MARSGPSTIRCTSATAFSSRRRSASSPNRSSIRSTGCWPSVRSADLCRHREGASAGAPSGFRTADRQNVKCVTKGGWMTAATGADGSAEAGLAGIVGDVRNGMIPAHIYNDRAVFELEAERVFGRSWVFVGHESEIPAAGDYVVRRVLKDSFIVVRDEEGQIRAHFNMCLHRGMQVCRAEMGNASHFRCPYHGWSYRNDGRLTGLPFHQDAYGGEAGFSRKGQALLPAPAL